LKRPKQLRDKKMRYARFQAGGSPVVGLVDGSDVIAIQTLLPGAPESLKEIIQAGEPLQNAIQTRLLKGAGERRPLADVHLLMPIPKPGKIICLGLNYADHAKEGGHQVPTYPSLFMRANTSLIGPNEPMIVPRCSERLDYEAELLIVVGKTCRHVTESAALGVIFGYSVFNDGSIRDYQRRTPQWTAGKNFDGTGAFGPYVVTPDELPPGAAGLGIRCLLNGRVLQDSNTERMIFNVPRTIAILSEIMTLEPGDLIATGTPEGVGHARTPPLWLKAGDTISVEIDQIGILTNPVASESGARAAA
jgi:2-keto-4-pentenoate hydratase/2-oxohepta-3-ene-1,7-dioic acid hydratase in catechol pathway